MRLQPIATTRSPTIIAAERRRRISRRPIAACRRRFAAIATMPAIAMRARITTGAIPTTADRIAATIPITTITAGTTTATITAGTALRRSNIGGVENEVGETGWVGIGSSAWCGNIWLWRDTGRAGERAGQGVPVLGCRDGKKAHLDRRLDDRAGAFGRGPGASDHFVQRRSAEDLVHLHQRPARHGLGCE